MTLDASKVAVAVSGEVWVGAANAAIPTSLTFKPDENGYKGLGYLTSDGFAITPDMSTSNITAWQNAANLRTLVTESSLQATFTCAETNKDVIEAFWGTTVDAQAGSYDVDPGVTGGNKTWIFQVIDGDHAELGTYIGEVTGREEITNQNGEVTGYGFTVSFYPSKKFNGKTGRVFNSRLLDESSSSSS